MTQQTNQKLKSKRLESLDILRGFILFLLVFLQPVLVALGRVADSAILNPILYQLNHVSWEGLRFWDLIMPLFLFITGVTMPFSFSRYANLKSKREPYKRIIRRVFLLFLLGMVVQGNLLGLDPKHLYLYSNTLQAIGVGYLIASVFQLHLSSRGQIIGTILLLLIYSIPMLVVGDFTPDGNFAEQIERIVLGRFRDGVHWLEDGTWAFSPHYHYTWIWSSLTFGVTVMLGVFAGTMIRKYKDNPKLLMRNLLVYALSLLVLGGICSIWIPVIKTIWTSSMTLISGGLCILFLLLFYFIIDYKGFSRGFQWLKIYGMNSIFAYVVGMVISFRSIAQSLCYGLAPKLGDYYSVLITFLNYGILFLILRLLYKHKRFFKV